MTARDSTTLAMLLAAYDKAVLFEEALPKPFHLAKLFTDLQWSGGGLVLLGVDADGGIVGVDPVELNAIYTKFEHLCAELTECRVEMGTLHLAGKVVVFLVFNTLPRNIKPLERYTGAIERVAII